MGILRKCLSIYNSNSIFQNCFFSFILPLFKYCAPVWRSAAETHLKLLEKLFNMVKFLLSEIRVDLCHRRLYHFFLKSLIILTSLSIVESPTLSFLSVILDKQLIKMIIALWLAGALTERIFSILCMYVCGNLCQMMLFHEV